MKMTSLNLRASTLPGLLHCYEYTAADTPITSTTGNENTKNNGVLQHAYLAALFADDKKAIQASTLNSKDANNVEQAYQKITAFIREYAPNATIESELPLTDFDGRGVADVIAYDKVMQTLVVIDYKSHETLKDYLPQVLWYARAYINTHALNVKAVLLGILFGDSNKLIVEELSQAEVIERVTQIRRKICENRVDKTKCASSWCSTCQHKGSCQTALSTVEAFNNSHQPKETLSTAQVADRLMLATEVERRIGELKDHARNLLHEGKRLINTTETVEYTLQEVLSYSVNVLSAFNYFTSLRNEKIKEAFLSKLTITKSDVEKILLDFKIGDTPKERGVMLNTMLIPSATVHRIKRILID